MDGERYNDEEQREREERERRKNALDRINRTIQRSRDIYQKGRLAAKSGRSIARSLTRFGIRAGARVGLAVAGEAAAATAPAWGTIAFVIIVALIGILVATILITILGGAVGGPEKKPAGGGKSIAIPSPANVTPTPWTGTCPVGSGYCSPDTLLNGGYFRDPTISKATNASMVCLKEDPTLDPFTINCNCLGSACPTFNGTLTLDYSIGLFQINLLAHCPNAFSCINSSPSGPPECNRGTTYCTIGDQTKLDQCTTRFQDPTENIKMMVLLSKDGTNWTPWLNSANACNLLNAPTPGPTLPPGTNLAATIQATFGITVVGFDNYPQTLQWMYEKFVDVSKTNFINLVRGTTIIAWGSSEQVDNNTIHLKPYTNQQTLNVILTHELGHIIQVRTNSFTNTLSLAIFAEGYLTTYSANANADINLPPSDPNYGNCTGYKFNEDYAETIAYYLNPTAPSITSNFPNCASDGSYPYANGAHPLHFDVARNILGTYP